MKKRLLRIGLKITSASICKISANLWIFANRLAKVSFQRSLSGCLVLVSVMMAVLLATGSHAFASGYDANANLKAGDVYNAHFATVTDTTWTTNGASKKTTQVEELNMLLTVQNLDQDHNATIQCKFTALTPSEPPEVGSPRDWFNQLFAGKIFSAKVSSRGEVLEITALGAVDTEFKMLIQPYLEDTIKRLVATLNGHFPRKSVQVGDTWDDTAKMYEFVPITLKRNWKFVSDKDGILTVEGKGKMSVSNGQMDTGAKVNLEGDVEETLHMHKDHLFVQTRTWTEHAKGTIDDPNQGQPLKMLITVEGKGTFEITKQ